MNFNSSTTIFASNGFGAKGALLNFNIDKQVFFG